MALNALADSFLPHQGKCETERVNTQQRRLFDSIQQTICQPLKVGYIFQLQYRREIAQSVLLCRL